MQLTCRTEAADATFPMIHVEHMAENSAREADRMAYRLLHSAIERWS
jgi:hypothetical protein